MTISRRGVLAGAFTPLLFACAPGAKLREANTAPPPTHENTPVRPATGQARVLQGREAAQALRAHARNGEPLPAGTYEFSGPPLTGEALTLRGSGASLTRINLAPDGILVDDAARWESFELAGVTISGGLGAVRSRCQQSNVAGIYRVTDCIFTDYSNCAIESNSPDMPYWHIERNIFRAKAGAPSIGVALSGLTDGSLIQGNKFLENLIHLKLGSGGNNTYVRENDFIQFSEGENRWAVWIVPATEGNNSGAGLIIESCKFGNENISSTDRRIVYCDEDDGEFFGSRRPAIKRSSGYITGHTIKGCLFVGADNNRHAPITSFTPHVRACLYGPLTLAGTVPAYMLEFRSGAGDSGQTNHVGPILLDNLRDLPSASNVPAAVRVVEA